MAPYNCLYKGDDDYEYVYDRTMDIVFYDLLFHRMDLRIDVSINQIT